MIFEYRKGNKKYKFVDDTRINDANLYTVIVGKNGTGKSRLLSSIISNIINKSISNKSYVQLELDFKIYKNEEIIDDCKTSKIIAVSTSPFDKFPLYIDASLRYRDPSVDSYKYLGLRDLRSSNFGLSYMSKIIGSLLRIIYYNNNQYINICRVLDYLGYTDKIVIQFDFRISKYDYNELISIERNSFEYGKFFDIHARIYGRYFRKKNREIDLEKVDELIKILGNRESWRKKIYNIEISKDGIITEIYKDNFFENFNFLFESGLVRLRNVDLRKNKSGSVFKINEASSGEQCIITTILGIACYIEDNSLICIDEPEISLHPEWQAKYIKILMTTFKDYKNCQFLIATHSPQLVSNLSDENCYVLVMDNRKLRNASDFINQSVDFQLANVFNSPGYKNEYLTRLIFTIMSKVAKIKSFDKEDNKNYSIIEGQIKNMDKSDPLRHLFDLLIELKVKYA